MLKKKMSFLVLGFFCSIWPILVYGQTNEFIYRQNIVESLAVAHRTENITFYFMTIGREISSGRHLKELPSEIRASIDRIMQPVNAAGNRRFAFPEGSVEIKQIDAETRLLEMEAVEKLRGLLGPELLLQASNEYAKSQIESLIETHGVSGLISLIDRAIKKPKLSGLTSDQIERIEKSKDQFQKNLEELDSQYLTRLRTATRELWPRLMKALDKTQELEAEQLLGKQAEWFRFLEQPKSLEVKSSSFGVVFAGTEIREKYKDNILRILDVPDSEWEKQGIEVIDPLIFDLLSYSFIEDELDFTHEQRRNLKNLREKHWSARGVSYLKHSDDRLDLLLNQNAPLPAGITDLLLPGQQLWLLQIELQLRTGIEYRSTAGLTHPKLIEHLSLSSKQVIDLKQIGEEYLAEWNPIFEDYRNERKTLHEKVLDEIRQIVSAKTQKMPD
jgi:hypothetical protein